MNQREAEAQQSYGPVFWIGLVIGWAVIGWGLAGVLQSVWLKDRPLRVLWWVLGGLVVHDALLAPFLTLAAIALGLAISKPRVRGPIAAGLVLSGVVVLFSYPLWRGFGRRAANETILPLDYPHNVGIIVLAIWIGVAATLVVRRVRGARS
jgi:hypothetical protein